MGVQYMKLLVHCSRRKGRVFQMDVAVAPNNALVTGVELLPEGYEEQLWRRRNHQESRVEIPAHLLDRMEGAIRCPFCRQTATFHCCHCGQVSCMEEGAEHHYCGGCEKVYKCKPAETIVASDSGFGIPSNRWLDAGKLWGQYQIPGEPGRIAGVPPALEDPRAAGDRMLKAAFQDRLQRQLAGRETRALPAQEPRQIEGPKDPQANAPNHRGQLPGGAPHGLLPPAETQTPPRSIPKLLPPAPGAAEETSGQQPGRRWSADLDPDVAARLKGKPAGSSQGENPTGQAAEWPPRPSGRLSGLSDQPAKGPTAAPTVRTRKFRDRPREKSVLEKLTDRLKGLID